MHGRAKVTGSSAGGESLSPDHPIFSLGANELRALADAAPVLIWLSDVDARRTYFNKPWLDFTGRPIEQELGNGWADGVHPEDIGRSLADVLQSFDARAPFSVEYRLRRHDGQYRWMLDSGSPRHSTTGDFLGYAGSCIDITEHRQMERDQSLLLEASHVLSSSLDYEETLQQIARLAVPRLADLCLVDIVGDDGPARGVAVAHHDPEIEQRLREFRRSRPPQPERLDPLVRQVLAQGRPLVVNDIPEERLRATIAREVPEISADALPRHLLCIPLQIRGVTIGAITFGAAVRGRYRRADVVLAEELARRCATAIDNARLYRDAQRRADLLNAVAGASRAFAEATLDAGTLVDTVAEQIGAITGEGCIVRLVADDDVGLDAVAVWHTDPAAARLSRRILRGTGPDASGRLPGAVLASGESILLTAPAGRDLRDQVAPLFRPYVERFRVTSLLIVPLRVRGRVFGTLSLSREGDRPAFTREECDFRRGLADRAALAIDNALQYAAERSARAEAEAANRAKDEFLSVLSHELRTPLTPILGLTQLWLRRPHSNPEVIDAIKTIDRNARIQARLVEDLLEVSRIVTGRLPVEMRPIDLTSAVEAAVDGLRPVAAEKPVALAAEFAPSMPPVMADAQRVRQIVWNLLSNAIKFTPAGGRVTLALEARQGMAAIIVRDTGIGIDPDFLPLVFDRFRQADASSTRAFAGLGIGLAIVHHLVALHNGQVSAESEGTGRGATLTVLLPFATDPGSDPRHA